MTGDPGAEMLEGFSSRRERGMPVGEAIGQSLPVAVGVMVSPLPVVAVVLMLLSGKARANAFAFVLTWFVAIALLTGVVAFLAGTSAGTEEQQATWVSGGSTSAKVTATVIFAVVASAGGAAPLVISTWRWASGPARCCWACGPGWSTTTRPSRRCSCWSSAPR